MRNELKRQSYVITDGPDRAAARAMLMFGDDGLKPEDLDKPIVGSPIHGSRLVLATTTSVALPQK